MKQLFKQEELLGKTISKILIPTEYASIFIRFSDDSFVEIISTDYSEGFENYETIKISNCSREETCYELVELGLVSEKKYKIACENEDIENDIRRKENDEKDEKENRLREIELLEQLQNKYKKF